MLLQKGSGFPRKVQALSWTILGKHAFRAALDCQPDVAIWTSLVGASKGHSKAGPNGLSDCTLREVVVSMEDYFLPYFDGSR